MGAIIGALGAGPRPLYKHNADRIGIEIIS
jgi:hypothetical protein